MRRRILPVIILLALVSGCAVKPGVESAPVGGDLMETYSSPVPETAEVPREEAERPDVPDHSSCSLDYAEASGDAGLLCVYDGVKHECILDLPKESRGAPLVLMLHGYGGSALGFRRDTAFEQTANPRGYAVAYVTGAPSPEDPTSSTCWNSGIAASGNRDVEFLCALANYLCGTYGFDADRVFAAGFSNGAFMTHRLAVEAYDIFAAVVSVTGMMPENIWKECPDRCSVGVFQITGEKDDAIPKNSDGSAKYAKAPAIENVMEYYVRANGLGPAAETCTVGNNGLLVKYSSDQTQKQVWDLSIPDGRHSWPGEKITGIRTNELILEFLETQ